MTSATRAEAEAEEQLQRVVDNDDATKGIKTGNKIFVICVVYPVRVLQVG